MEKLYCLFNISSNTCYTTIQGCRPTPDYVLLENLRAYISMVKPSTAACVMEILETDENCSPSQSARELITKIRERLS